MQFSPEHILKRATQTIKLEGDALYKLGNSIGDEFVSVIQLILSSNGRIVLSGMGKSADVARKTVSTLNSTGSPAFFVHAGDAVHGDLGGIQHGDVVLCFSKSGRSAEILAFASLIRSAGHPIVAVTGSSDSQLASLADHVILAGVDPEACPFDLAPTTSTAVQMALGDAIALCLMEAKGFGVDDFARNHPGGTLGKRLTVRVSDLADSDRIPSVDPRANLQEVLLSMTTGRYGATVVIDSGNIVGIGPRYCPSIEDKIFKFASKESHQIFIEPEGIGVDLVYPNGISTSLPKDIQEKFIKSIKGMEDSVITEFGYAVEYDFVDPRSLKSSLETKFFKNFYLAGQINGTTGYEEAAAQGLMAGINACRAIQKKQDFVLERSEAYIGVLINDLTNHGITEPYRMFTSRAEHRLLLSQNNAEQRLLKKAFWLGLVEEERYKQHTQKEQQYQDFINKKLKTKKLKSFINKENKKINLQESKSVFSLLYRTDANKSKLFTTNKENHEFYKRAATEAKYEGYIQKQTREIAKTKKQNRKKIPKDTNYSKINGLSNEVKEKLNTNRPETIGSAANIEGVTPAAINLILIQLKKNEMQKQNA